MTARHRLRNRRAHEVVAFKFRGVSYVVGFSRFSDGALAEVFIDNHKCTSALAADARDAAVALSISLQHGVPPRRLGPL